MLGATGLVAIAVWAFVEITDEVVEGETHAIDERVLTALRAKTDLSDPIGPIWVEEMMRDVTALGGVSVLVLLTLIATGLLLLERKRRAAWLLLAAVATGQVLSSLLKIGIDRPRPDLVPHGSEVYTASFPSGHALMAAVTYLTVGAMLARAHPRRATKVYLLSVALFLSFAVGVTRVYLGVHWPSDVLAGWAAGAAWSVLCLVIAALLERRVGIRDPSPKPS